jgi:hypothetical protein
MVETTLIKQRVEPDKVSRLKDWLTNVQNREEEALATLEDEGVLTESAFLEETPRGTFLVTFIEAEDLDAMWGAFADSDHDIDAEFKTVLDECLADDEGQSEFEPLYHLARPDR